MVDVSGNRRARKWSRGEQVGRVLWALCHPLFALSPRPLWGWRRMLLRLFGARIGREVHIYPSVRVTIPWHLHIGEGTAIGDRVTLYALGQITLGARVTVSQGVHLCAGTHDWRLADMPLLKPPISIGDDAWLCADAFVGPGVSVGSGAIVAARAVAVKDVPAGMIAGGNPARIIKPRSPVAQAAQ